MVDAEARVARPAVRLIIPEGPHPAIGMPAEDRVGPTIIQQAAIGLPAFGLHQRVVLHRLDREGVDVARDDIIVARQDRGHFLRPDFCGAVPQALHPAELIIEFRAGLRIAVGQIDAGDAHALHIRLQIAAMLVLRLAFQAPTYLDGAFAAREDGDAVESLLPVPDHAIAGVFDILDREGFVAGLDFLKAGDVGPRFVQPFQQARQARLDAVDVEGGDAHGLTQSL